MSNRVMGIDVGTRRIGLAMSDATGMLARPLTTLQVRDEVEAIARVAQAIGDAASDEDGLAAVVVGMPSHLDGSASPETARVIAFVEALRARTGVAIVTEGERLTSREAESRLAVHERNWRKRKAKIDAMAAAIILQDYLDRRSG